MNPKPQPPHKHLLRSCHHVSGFYDMEGNEICVLCWKIIRHAAMPPRHFALSGLGGFLHRLFLWRHK